MEEKCIQNQVIRHMDCRFDQIERLITLSLMNDIIPQYMDDLSLNLSDEIVTLIKENDFTIVKTEIFADKIAVYLKTDKIVGVKEFRNLKKLLVKKARNIILVFELDKATITQKRKFIEEKISYHVADKELFILKN